MPAPFAPRRRPSLAPSLGVALLLHAAVVAAAFLVPRSAADLLFGKQDIALSNGPAGLEQEVILSEAPPEEALPVPAAAEEAAPALAAAAAAPEAEPPPPPEPEPDFVQPAAPSPAPSLSAAEPVARAVAVPTAPAVPEVGPIPAPPRIVIGNDGFPRPSYPYQARSLRQEGTVVLALAVVNGAVVSATVVGTSGYPLLDRAAVQCVRTRWRFPAAVTASVTQPIRFALDS